MHDARSKRVDSQGEHFTGIHDRFLRDQVYRESQLKIGWSEENCKEMDEICKTKPHVPSLYRGIQKIQGTMISHHEQVGPKMGLCDCDPIFELLSLSKTVSTACQVSKLQNQFLHNHTGDDILLQAHRGGTRLDAIGGVRKNF